MSSNRLPGKMLAPFRGRPLVDHVMDAAFRAVGRAASVLLTSTHATDDPLAAYAEHRKWSVFRGDLDNVFKRFRDALSAHPADWVVRICGDSPLISSELINEAIAMAHLDAPDLVSNVFPRTYPKGQSVEVIRATLLESLDPDTLSANEREHVTPYFYANAEKFRIVNMACPADFPVSIDCVVDALDDLKRLEQTAI